MLAYFHDYLIDQYDWFIRMDDDAVLQWDNLNEFLKRDSHWFWPTVHRRPAHWNRTIIFTIRALMERLKLIIPKIILLEVLVLVVTKETLLKIIWFIAWVVLE